MLMAITRRPTNSRASVAAPNRARVTLAPYTVTHETSVFQHTLNPGPSSLSPLLTRLVAAIYARARKLDFCLFALNARVLSALMHVPLTLATPQTTQGTGACHTLTIVACTYVSVKLQDTLHPTEPKLAKRVVTRA
jgi:hypothetical protein